MIDLTGHPFIAASLILSIVVLIMSGIVSIARKDDTFVSAVFIHAVVWVLIGIGYVLV